MLSACLCFNCVYFGMVSWYLVYTYVSHPRQLSKFFPTSLKVTVLLVVAEDRKWNDEYQSIPLSRKSCQCRPRRRGRNNRCGWYRCHSRFHSGSHSRSYRRLRSGFRSGNRGFRNLQFAMDTFKTARTIAAKHTANTIVVEGKDGKRIDKKV